MKIYFPFYKERISNKKYLNTPTSQMKNQLSRLTLCNLPVRLCRPESEKRKWKKCHIKRVFEEPF